MDTPKSLPSIKGIGGWPPFSDKLKLLHAGGLSATSITIQLYFIMQKD